MWIDSHCHLDAPEFDADRTAVVQRAVAAGVTQLVLPAVEVANFDAVRSLAHVHGAAYALGIHPLYVHRAKESDLQALQLALERHRDDPRLVAVGEIGLDHFLPGQDLARQAHFYAAQLDLARQAGLPVILHVRRSADALLQQLRRQPVRGGIAHAFNGSAQQAAQFIAAGFKLGFGGALTFDRALQIRRLASELPAAALVLETDAPDIPPHWLYPVSYTHLDVYKRQQAAHGARQRLDGQRLGQPRHTFHQQMTLRQHAHQHTFEELVLPHDDTLDLVEDALHQRGGGLGVVLHRSAFSGKAAGPPCNVRTAA